MRKSYVPGLCALALSLVLLPSGAAAQQGAEPSGAAAAASTSPTHTSSRDRLYLNYIEDAMVVDEQWWEGWLQYDDAEFIDRTILYGRAAFQPWQNIEVGGSVGFGDTDTSSGLTDGNGATDLDLWGKYYWALGDDRAELAAGAVVTVPTGDDSVGLGFDAFALKGFGALRYRLDPVVLTGTVGLQLNGDGRTLGSTTRDGKTAFSVGLGVIAPWSEAFSWIGELTYESERFEGADDAAQLLGGINLRLSHRGMLRPAIALGLQDGAPDVQILVGYAYSF